MKNYKQTLSTPTKRKANNEQFALETLYAMIGNWRIVDESEEANVGLIGEIQ